MQQWPEFNGVKLPRIVPRGRVMSSSDVAPTLLYLLLNNFLNNDMQHLLGYGSEVEDFYSVRNDASVPKWMLTAETLSTGGEPIIIKLRHFLRRLSPRTMARRLRSLWAMTLPKASRVKH